MQLSPVQLTKSGQLKHFLTIEGLPRSLLEEMLQTAEQIVDSTIPDKDRLNRLLGKTVINLFFENSTRTRSTFEMAAQRLGAHYLNIDIARSATSKGETITDTLLNLQAMQADVFVVRHDNSGAAHFIAQKVTPKVAVINAGDGYHAHPTQAMLDMLTMRRHAGGISGKSVAIVGDVLHSRVARSDIHALKILGARDIRVIAPATLMPRDIESMGVRPFYKLSEGLKQADIVIMLRLQKERMVDALLPSETEYFNEYGLNQSRLNYAKPTAIVMHPGPINRGIEMTSSVADGPQSVILNQVGYGIAMRMAVMLMVVDGQTSEKKREQRVMMHSLLIRQARCIDPIKKTDRKMDILLLDGRIQQIATHIQGHKPIEILDAKGAILLPGVVDLSATIDNINTEPYAAARGGSSFVCARPDENSTLSSVADVVALKKHTKKGADIYPISSLTLQGKGRQLSDMSLLMSAGCIGVGLGNFSIDNVRILKQALSYTSTYDFLVFLTPKDRYLSRNGVMHEGVHSTQMGLVGVSETAETVALTQQLLLAEETGARIHISQLSCARSVELLVQAQKRGVRVTADVAISNLCFTDKNVQGYDNTFHVWPPLRTSDDRQALLTAVNRGQLAICSNHRPCCFEDKNIPFSSSRQGMSTLDTWLQQGFFLVSKGELELSSWLMACSIMPANIVGLNTSFSEGQLANFTLLDLQKKTEISVDGLYSYGNNNPFVNQELPGKVLITCINGRIVFNGK